MLKLYRTLKKNDQSTPRQLVFYDQGVGTIGQKSTWGVFRQKTASVWGLATGHGLDSNVLRAYRFICKHFEMENDSDSSTARDRIFLFGYSRGAHAVRVLAALIYNIGILRPEQLHLCGAALTAYKKARSGRKGEVDQFRRITQTKHHSVDFIGVWDTVSSMIVPKPDKPFLPTTEQLLNTGINPGVAAFRHAMSIDESRYAFRLDEWRNDQDFKPNPYSTGEIISQDCKQVWFAGFHGDVGGGNRRAQSGLSQYPLRWMIREAMQFGLQFNTRMVDYVSGGVPYTRETVHLYPIPDYKAPAHSSRRTAWAAMEFLPKRSRFREWNGPGKRPACLGLYFPFWEPRHIPDGALIHQSAIDRRNSIENYAPVNWPSKLETVAYAPERSTNWSGT